MTSTYITHGVCSTMITFEIENDVVCSVVFTSGCPGNLQGISHLVEGMDVSEAIRRLKGIKCGPSDTSCPDQLALALEEALGQRR
ncbi:MAG: TIGR03905 family TSCPD domain-containing protein [Bacillota bacterium]